MFVIVLVLFLAGVCCDVICVGFGPGLVLEGVVAMVVVLVFM